MGKDEGKRMKDEAGVEPLDNPRWEAFAVAYVRLCGDATKAYREGYPRCLKWKDESVWVRACRLLGNAKVKLRVKNIQTQISAEGIASADEVAKFLSKVIRAADDLKTPCFDKNGAAVINPRTEKPLMVDPPLRTRIAACDKLSRLMGYNKPVKLEWNDGKKPPVDADAEARLVKYVAAEGGDL